MNVRVDDLELVSQLMKMIVQCFLPRYKTDKKQNLKKLYLTLSTDVLHVIKKDTLITGVRYDTVNLVSTIWESWTFIFQFREEMMSQITKFKILL